MERLNIPKLKDDEVWLGIPNFPSYFISNYGRVYKIGRPSRANNGSGYIYKDKKVIYIEPKFLNTDTRRDVDLQETGFPPQRFTIAILVLTLFVGPKPEAGHVARHLNDDFTNNHVSNLAWGTRRDNRIDASRNGRQSSGSDWARKVGEKLRGRKRSKQVIANIRRGREKYFKLDAVAIRDIKSTPVFPGSGAALAKKYGVSASAISYVRRGKSWADAE